MGKLTGAQACQIVVCRPDEPRRPVRDNSVHDIHREAVFLGVGFDAGDEGWGEVLQLAHAHAVDL